MTTYEALAERVLEGYILTDSRGTCDIGKSRRGAATTSTRGL